MDRFTALRVFRAVVDCGSFAAAARDLGLSNAAVSKNIGELEAHLGTRLLNRTTRSMNLTEAGAHYYERMTRLLQDLADADDAVAEMTRVPRGRLRVNAPMSWGLLRLSNLMPDFLQRYPEVRVELELSDTVADLVEQHIDVAIRGQGAMKDSTSIARRLARLDRVVCGSPAYFKRHGTPGVPADLREHSCLVYSLSSEPEKWRFTREGKRSDVTVSGNYRVNNSLALRDALLAGAGIALIPTDYVREYLSAGRVKAVLEDWETNEQAIYAVYPSGRYLPGRVRAFIDFLIEKLHKHA